MRGAGSPSSSSSSSRSRSIVDEDARCRGNLLRMRIMKNSTASFNTCTVQAFYTHTGQ